MKININSLHSFIKTVMPMFSFINFGFSIKQGAVLFKILQNIFFMMVVVYLLCCIYIKYKIKRSKNTATIKCYAPLTLTNFISRWKKLVDVKIVDYDNSEINVMIGYLFVQIYALWITARSKSSVFGLIVVISVLLNDFAISPLFRAYIYNCEVSRPYDNTYVSNEPSTGTEVKKEKAE